MLIISSQWEVCHTLVNIAARSRRKLTEVSRVYLFQSPNEITSTVSNQLSLEDDNQDDIEEYDAEYDVNLFEEDGKTEPSIVDNSKIIIANDPVNIGVKRWFKDRNLQQPITLGDLLEADDIDLGLTVESIETQLIAIEDYDWFEPTLDAIELKYEKRKEQLLLSLSTDRKSSPSTVPLRANEILEKVLKEEMNSEIKRKYEKMKFERAKSFEKERAESFTVKRDRAFRETDTSKNTDILVEGNGILKESNRERDQNVYIERMIQSVKRDIENNRIEGRFWPDGVNDWKKLQQLRTYVKEQSLDGVVDEDEVESMYLEWKKFMLTQNIAIENVQKEEEMNVITDDEQDTPELDTIEQVRKEMNMEEQKLEISGAVEDINRKSLKALEELLERRGKNSDTEVLQKTILNLRESLEAVDYVDIQLDQPREEKKEVSDDTPVDFTEIFPVQATRRKQAKERENEENEYVRMFGHKSEYSRDQDFAEVEELMRNDSVSVRSNRTKNVEDALSSPPDTPFVSNNEVVDEPLRNPFSLENSDETIQEAKKPAFVSQGKSERIKPPNTPFFSDDVLETDNEPIEKKKNEEYGMTGSDLNKPPEERSTALLGTYEEQRMDNFYRQAGASTDEDQVKAKQDLDDFQRHQEEKMRQLENMEESEFELGYDVNDIIKDGDVDMEKILSLVNAKRKALNTIDNPRNEEDSSTATIQNITDSVDESNSKLSEEQEPEGVDTQTEKDSKQNHIERMEAEKELEKDSVMFDQQFESIEGSDINLPPEQRSTALLGTFEEQNMSNIYRQSGIRNKDEKEKFSKQYNEFLRKQDEGIEKLQEINDEDYDFEALITEDGDVDAQKILSLINEKLATKGTSKESVISLDVDSESRREQEFSVKESNQQDLLSEKNDDSSTLSELSENEVDPNKEPVTSEFESDKGENIDSSDMFGLSPTLGNKRIFFKNDNTVKSNIARGDIFGDEEPHFNIDSKEETSEKLSTFDVEYPEQEELDLTEETDETTNIVEDYEENKRRIEEAVGVKSSGLDFYELFGRRPGEYDYEDDYRKKDKIPVRDENANLSSYLARKKMLLDLKVISKAEVDMVMEIKDSIELKDFSPHMARITKPFKEYGAIFRLEGVLVDISVLQAKAWERVIEKLNLGKPSERSIRYASVQTPEYAARRIFFWTTDHRKCTEIGWAYNQFLMEEVNAAFDMEDSDSSEMLETDSSSSGGDSLLPLTDGVKSWIKALLDVEMPVALVSYLDDELVDTILNKTGLADVFPEDRRVTKTSGLNRDSYLQLAACLHVDRRPDACLLFEANMEGLGVARENDLRSVGMTTVYPSYDLQAADTTVRDFNYMTAMNIRRIFGERTYEEPMTMSDLPLVKIQKRKVLTVYPGEEAGDDGGDGDDGGRNKNNNYNRFYSNDMKYDSDVDQDRYYGDDNYSPARYNDIQEDGLLYDEGSENDLFQ